MLKNAILDAKICEDSVKIWQDFANPVEKPGKRVLMVGNNPAYDAGNRYGLPSQIDLNWQAFQSALDTARSAWGE